ncbi:tail fiber assembly protein [Ewingella sp. CoE-038-23]|uniref:tail fiber assembly protein n=1 Tax=Ewingella docleensis TaxID=3118588 RepID=UPI00336549CC
MTYLFNAAQKAFYPTSLKDAYEAAGTWPDEGAEVDESVFDEFTAQPPKGKVLSSTEQGLPCWDDAPKPTPEQLAQQAESVRQQLISNANQVTSDWRTELSLGIISDDDKASLTAWMQYIKAVRAVDVTQLPVTFPAQPK